MPIFVFGSTAGPSPFWQSLMSPGITFMGTLVVVWLTNKYASKNLRQQRVLDETRLRDQWGREDQKQWDERQHEAEEALKERLVQQRKDICLRLVDALARYQGSLPTLATNLVSVDNRPLQDLLASAAQAELVVEPQTAMTVRHLVSAVGQMNMRLLAQRMPMQVLYGDWVRLEATQNPNEELKDRIKHKRAALDRLLLAFYKAMLQEIKRIVSHRAEVLAALRRDLELAPEDQEALLKYLMDDANRAIEMFHQLVKAARSATRP